MGREFLQALLLLKLQHSPAKSSPRLAWRRAARHPRTAAALVAAGCLMGAVPSARAAETNALPFVTAQTRAVAYPRRAYGQVVPITLVQVRTANAGVLHDLRAVPGTVVKAGDVLARIGGPRMRALLVEQEQTLRSATAGAEAADQSLRIARRQFAAQLVTRQAVETAQANRAAARAAVRMADAKLRELRGMQTVGAPAAGTVLAVQAADGEQLAAGQRILTIQPAGGLWIRAAYYGADAAMVHVGMHGRFRPTGRAQAVPVKVSAVSPALAADGGVRIGVVPTGAAARPWWVNGQWGTLTLETPVRPMVMVPTQALILDRGHWWVLVHTPSGDRPRQVVPGIAQGWRTAIVSGLQPGQQVVVTDAFLAFHRDIASRYTPPD